MDKAIQQVRLRGEFVEDDGENCWDCGDPNDDGLMNICSTCGATLCWDCQGGQHASLSTPHRCGTERRL